MYTDLVDSSSGYVSEELNERVEGSSLCQLMIGTTQMTALQPRMVYEISTNVALICGTGFGFVEAQHRPVAIRNSGMTLTTSGVPAITY